MKLEPGSVATVWSADVGAEHDPPRDIVMKGQKWFVADSFTTALINNEQEVNILSLYNITYYPMLIQIWSITTLIHMLLGMMRDNNTKEKE